MVCLLKHQQLGTHFDWINILTFFKNISFFVFVFFLISLNYACSLFIYLIFLVNKKKKKNNFLEDSFWCILGGIDFLRITFQPNGEGDLVPMIWRKLDFSPYAFKIRIMSLWFDKTSQIIIMVKGYCVTRSRILSISSFYQ